MSKRKKAEVILASQSGIRKQMLKDQGIPFEVIVSNADETPNMELHTLDRYKDIALRKAMTVFEQTQDRGKRIIVAADFNYIFQGKFYGKPDSIEEAKKFINLTKGTECLIAVTGNAIICAYKNRIDHIFNEGNLARLSDDSISEETIDEYLSKTDPLKKAGGMNISDAPFLHLEQGNRSTAMGMTVEHLIKALKFY